MRIKISNFGNLLVSRPDGKEAFLAAKAYILRAAESEFILDFADVDVLATAWADEFIGGGIKREFQNTSIKYENTSNPSVQETLNMI
ncbi:MAG: STAS-like domain-containing protein [Endomicrobium sp.]|jgi:hypothetical protein|nr:STAS-like domain-containing protein [Endomicrobium sp.]